MTLKVKQRTRFFRSAKQALWFLSCLFFSAALHAQSSIIIFSPPGDKLAARTAGDVRAQLAERNVSSSFANGIDDLNALLNGESRVLAIGNRACDEVVFQGVEVEVLCGLINHYFQPGDIGLTNVDYMPLEVPATQYFKLAKLMVPEAETVGVLLGPESHHRERFYNALARAAGMDTEFSLLTLSSNPVTSLDPAMRKSQVFMVLPDAADFNRAVAPWVLQLSLRYRMPLLGYSFNYANAGAIASLFQSREDLAANLVNRLFDPNSIMQFSIRLNYSVAQNLGIELLSEQEYLDLLSGEQP